PRPAGRLPTSNGSTPARSRPSTPPAPPLPSFFFTASRPPRRTPLFPYTTLFRSGAADHDHAHGLVGLEPREDAGKLVAHRDRHRSEEHTSELQSRGHLVCRLLLEKKTAGPAAPSRGGAGCEMPTAPRLPRARPRS